MAKEFIFMGNKLFGTTMLILDNFKLCSIKDDELIWKPNTEGTFSVNSFYKTLLDASLERQQTPHISSSDWYL